MAMLVRSGQARRLTIQRGDSKCKGAISMGSNIHIRARYPDKGLKDWPADLVMGENCATLWRYTDSYEFMKLVWEDYDDVCDCVLDGHDKCRGAYYCFGGISRPKDLAALRVKTKHLQVWVPELIDYLESEPNAWLEYD